MLQPGEPALWKDERVLYAQSLGLATEFLVEEPPIAADGMEYIASYRVNL